MIPYSKSQLVELSADIIKIMHLITIKYFKNKFIKIVILLFDLKLSSDLFLPCDITPHSSCFSISAFEKMSFLSQDKICFQLMVMLIAIYKCHHI